MALTKLARIDTSPALDTRDDDAAALASATAPLQNVENGALPPTPLSADIKTNMPYNVYNAQRQRELEEYKSIFNQNMKNKPVKHDKAHVFMWTWEEKYDDLKVKKEVRVQSFIIASCTVKAYNWVLGGCSPESLRRSIFIRSRATRDQLL